MGNNVLAHVPNINDFVKAMKLILKSNGIITMEFPHLLQLINENQFDTIYHEHFSYLSLIAVNNIFQKHGLCIFDVEELNTHGGSLRIYAKHMEDTSKDIHQNVAIIVEKEIKLGLNEVEAYTEFHEKVKK
ncbi:class I SAM-dependent methyltransferase [Clostridium botulinum]|nr:class I SAM-dependent methyltransferase [Clostridium botulinum]MCS4465334.1 class I SAM-dependent methyltransferase [Clostridium botulinum]MCS4465915.1 class I SAM-dependent methyltransferase [Clostridium botulinum]MCS4524049.1 class I SAM-dependent methyltransferase [Clostridium botulinum]MCS4526641.1 class I SAM-dependent methyltransferase [Clostridium botulinum]